MTKLRECKHKDIERFRTYETGDCYYYHKKCKSCGKEVGGWTPEEAEKEVLTND
jgi:hypothetical protein